MAEAVEYNPAPIEWRDTWNGLRPSPVVINGGPPPEALGRCVVEFYKVPTATGSPSLVISTDDENQIGVIDAATWHVIVKAQRLDLLRGNWYYRLTYIGVNGLRKTYLRGMLVIK